MSAVVRKLIGDGGKTKATEIARFRIGVATRAGNASPRQRKENQDSWCGVTVGLGVDSDLPFVGVYDGHGAEGEKVSGFISRTLPVEFERDGASGIGVEKRFKQACLASNALLAKERFNTVRSGSSGISLLFEADTLHTANVGDSRAVLGRFSDPSFVMNLSVDQKPDRPDEFHRIRAAGGQVYQRPRDCARVAGLAMSRAFGDFHATPSGVIAEPEVTKTALHDDSFAVVGSDGVWDFVTSEEACALTSDLIRHGETCEDVAASLVLLATARWKSTYDDGYVDDITAVVVASKNVSQWSRESKL